MDRLMPGWTDVEPITSGKPSITFPDGQKERFDDAFLDAWGNFAVKHKADGVDCIIAYMEKGSWRKMTTAASKIQHDIKPTSIFDLTEEQIVGHFIRLFEQKYDGFKTKVYKGARGVGAELSDDEFIAALVEKVSAPKSTGAAAKGGARKRRSTRRKRVVKRKSGRKTRKTKKARKASRKTKKGRKTSRKTKKSRKAGRKTRKTTRKARKTSRKTYRKH